MREAFLQEKVNMDYRFLWILVAVLLLIIVGLLLRMNLYKKQLRSFTKQLNFFRKEKKDGLIRVESFGKEYIGLAKELQQFVDEEQELIEQSEKDRQSVKHMVPMISELHLHLLWDISSWPRRMRVCQRKQRRVLERLMIRQGI